MTEYSHAITSSGLAVTEVADRFHLITNMEECIADSVSGRYDEIAGILRGQEGKGDKEVGKRGRRKEHEYHLYEKCVEQRYA